MKPYVRVLLFGFLFGAINAFGAPQAEQNIERLRDDFNRLWNKAEILAAVESKNKNQAWLLDVDAQLISPFLNYWVFSDLLDCLLEEFSKDLSERARSDLIATLHSTFARYVIEVLFEYRINSETISDVVIKNNNETLVLQAKIKGPLGLPVSLEFNSVAQGDSVFITDMVVGGIAYSDWKRRYYKSYAKKNDFSGLIHALQTKNSEFFVRFCEVSVEENGVGTEFVSQLPVYIQQSCALDNGI